MKTMSKQSYSIDEPQEEEVHYLDEVPHHIESACGHVGRSIVSVLLTIAIISSIISTLSCKYYTFHTLDDRPSGALDPPFASSTEITVGLFSYRILNSADPGQEQDECVSFPERFQNFEFGNAYWTAAQFCSTAAAALGFVGWLSNLVEIYVCNFYCSFMWTAAFCIGAGLFQMCTFMLYLDHTFCFQDTVGGNHSCELNDASYMSMGAMAGFLVSGILLGCLPRPDPCCGNFCCAPGYYDDCSDDEEDGEDREFDRAIYDDDGLQELKGDPMTPKSRGNDKRDSVESPEDSMDSYSSYFAGEQSSYEEGVHRPYSAADFESPQKSTNTVKMEAEVQQALQATPTMVSSETDSEEERMAQS